VETTLVDRARSHLPSWLVFGVAMLLVGAYLRAIETTGGDKSPLPQTIGGLIEALAHGLDVVAISLLNLVGGA
jgi:hypothetical protein